MDFGTILFLGLIFAFFIYVTVTIVMHGTLFRKRKSRIQSNMEDAIKSNAPNATYAIRFENPLQESVFAYTVDTDSQTVCLFESKEACFLAKTLKIPFDTIIGANIETDGAASGGVGRAIVGGVVAGDVGAIVGAQTAKKRIQNLNICIITNDISTPIIRLNLIENYSMDSNGRIAIEAMNFCRNVCASVKSVIENVDKSSASQETSELIKVSKNSRYTLLSKHVDCPQCGYSVNATPCPNCGNDLSNLL